MKIKFGIATFAAASSIALISGNTAQAEVHPFLSTPVELTTISEAIAELPTLQLPEHSDSATVPHIEVQLAEPVAIATESNAPVIPPHPVTDPSNSYAWGQCTWYVKNKRLDLPNNLGNANTWHTLAQSQGYEVNTTPYPGAVGVTTAGMFGHVVFVESVNPDGTVNISEMNYAGGIGSVHHRTVPAGDFIYIY